MENLKKFEEFNFDFLKSAKRKERERKRQWELDYGPKRRLLPGEEMADGSYSYAEQEADDKYYREHPNEKDRRRFLDDLPRHTQNRLSPGEEMADGSYSYAEQEADDKYYREHPNEKDWRGTWDPHSSANRMKDDFDDDGFPTSVHPPFAVGHGKSKYSPPKKMYHKR